MTRKVLLFAAVAAALCAAAVAPVCARAADNTAVAVDTRDGASVYRFAFKILRVNSTVVDEGNAAVAAASCTGCRTVAVAIEVLLVNGDASVISPTNEAIALNVDCSDCETLAAAYQYVLFGDDPVRLHFTADGYRRLAAVRRDAEQLRHADLTIWEVAARVAALAAEVRDVLATELVAAGPRS